MDAKSSDKSSALDNEPRGFMIGGIDTVDSTPFLCDSKCVYVCACVWYH